MRCLTVEVAPGVHRRIPGFYAQGGKYYLVDDEIQAEAGEPVRLDRVIDLLVERYGMDRFRFERIRKLS